MGKRDFARFEPKMKFGRILQNIFSHDDVIKWKHFPRYWPFVRGIHRWIPRTRASDAELWCFFDLYLNKRLSKQSWGWWFETPLRPLRCHYNGMKTFEYQNVGLYWRVYHAPPGTQCLAQGCHVTNISIAPRLPGLKLPDKGWPISIHGTNAI